jgi:hypothetical protein
MTTLSAIRTQALVTALQRSALKGYGARTTIAKFLKGANAGSKQSDATLPKDTLDLAEPLKALAESGLDLEKSRFAQSAQLLSFDLNYQEESFQQVTLQGYYDFQSQSLTADFSFVSALAIQDPPTGEERQDLFRFTFHLEASHSVARTGSTSLQKEDILQFARKLVTKIAGLYAEGKEIDGLALDSEDLKDLGAVDHGRLLEKIMALVQVLKMASWLEKREGEHVLASLEREKSLVSQETSQEQESLAFSLSVERVQTESTSEAAPAQNAPEQA